MKISPGSYRGKSHCGYCKGESTSKSFGFLAYELTPEEYQGLIDRGFRRSGVYVYKPDLAHSCCPQYTIRLAVDDFKPKREHRQGLNRFNRHVGGDSVKAHKSKGKENQFSLLKAIHEAEGDSFEIKLVSSEFTDEKYQLFRQYQMFVHNETEDEVTEDQFDRFLCETPFVNLGSDPSRKDYLGPAHQMYYHNGKLIGLGVLDILPHCISSVYFIWHKDYAKWGMGKIASLQEVGLALELNKPYYYMGFYIHSCEKMKYKAQYRPSFLLEPRFTEMDSDDSRWKNIELYEYKLDESNYVTLVDKPPPTYSGAVFGDSTLFASQMPGLLSPDTIKSLDPRKYVKLVIDVQDGVMEVPIGLDDIIPKFQQTIKLVQLEIIAILGQQLAKGCRIKVG